MKVRETRPLSTLHVSMTNRVSNASVEALASTLPPGRESTHTHTHHTLVMPRGQVESSRVKSSVHVYAYMFPQAQHVLSHDRTNRPAWYAKSRPPGIEPGSSAWQVRILPLDDGCVSRRQDSSGQYMCGVSCSAADLAVTERIRNTLTSHQQHRC